VTARLLTIATALGLITGCAADAPAPHVQEIASPAGPRSQGPNLAAGPDGAVYLSWIEIPDSAPPVLKFAVKTVEGWTQPRTIVQTEDLIVNYADFPSLLVYGDGMLAAHWMAAAPDGEGYHVQVAWSRDGGETWSKPVVPHTDRTAAEHGFVSMAPHPDGGFSVIWLDGRKLDPVAMMAASVGPDGALGAETRVDDRVCECCQTSAAAVPGGVIAAYRDRSDAEVRDISIVRFDGARWSEPRTVFADKWEIYACPVNGPAVAAQGKNVAVAWFTAASDKPRVHVALSSNGGETFGAPVQVDGGNPSGRVDVAVLESGSAMVSWLERTNENGEVRARQVDANGSLLPFVVVGPASPATSSGFPRMERSGNSFIFAWIDAQSERVRTAVLQTH